MNIYLGLPLLAFVFNISLAVLVLLRDHRDFVHRIFSLFLISMALWGITIFGMRASPDLERALLWERVVIVMISGVSVFFYHFSLAFTKVRPRRGLLPAAYLFLLFVISISPTSLSLTGMQIKPYGYAPVPGPFFFFPGVLGVYLLIILGLRNLIKAYRASTFYNLRTQYRYIVIGLVCSLIGGVFDLVPVFGLPSYPGAIIGNVIFAVLATLAILKYHLLDIRFVVRKGLAYLLLSSMVAIPYVSILLLMSGVLNARLQPWWTHAVIVLLLAILLRPLYSWAQGLADKLFYRDRYDYLKALQHFTQEAKSILNLRELSSSMTRLVSGALRTPKVSLLLPSESDRGLVVESCRGLDNPPSGVVLREGSLLVKWLRRHGRIMSAREFDIIPELQSLARTEKQNLEKLGSQLYVPIKTREGNLSGLLILGEKLGQRPYSREDRELVSTMTNQMATVLENARLYEGLRQSEEHLSTIFETTREGVIVTGSDGGISFANPAAAAMLGYKTAAELVGRHATKIYLDPRQRKVIFEREMGKGYIENIEVILKKEDGTPVYVLANITVYRDKEGNILRTEALFTDITERKQAEERETRLQQELYLSSRLAAIGELAAGVAHELNNPLTGILGFSQRLLRKSTDEKVSRDLERIHSEAQRATKVVNNLLSFARRREPEREPADINDIVQQALELRAYELKTGNIEVALDLAPSLPKIMVDFRQMQEVLLNIILNAEQAMTEAKGRGKLTIKTQKMKDYIRVSFTDDGPGIPAEHLDKLFNPFFTTREKKGGTGLGLSVCHGVVVEHGGRIYAKSRPGKGATFFVELPLSVER